MGPRDKSQFVVSMVTIHLELVICGHVCSSMRSSNSVNVVNLVMMDIKYKVQIYIIHIRYTACSVKRCMQSCVPYDPPAGGVWL